MNGEFKQVDDEEKRVDRDIEDNPYADLSDEEFMELANKVAAEGRDATMRDDVTDSESLFNDPRGGDIDFSDADTPEDEDASNEPLVASEDVLDDDTDGDLDTEDSGDEEDEDSEQESSNPSPFEETGETKETRNTKQTESESEPDQGSEDSDEEEVNYRKFYEKVMAPFKANKTTIELKDPDEVIRLMQMGANYTQKMQALAPSMKILRMLERNDLLDEDQLSFLIDVHKKNPGAISKLVKDAEIDPMDIDTTEEAEYKPGQYKVSDAEMAFLATMNDLTATSETGNETIVTINREWDDVSKDAIVAKPDIMIELDNHRKSGLYDVVMSEIQRRRTLGTLRGNNPTIQVYEAVANELYASGQLNPNVVGKPPQQQNQTQPARRPARRTNKADASGDRVRAMNKAPGKTTKKSAISDFDPFNMSDDEIEAMAKPPLSRG